MRGIIPHAKAMIVLMSFAVNVHFFRPRRIDSLLGVGSEKMGAGGSMFLNKYRS